MRSLTLRLLLPLLSTLLLDPGLVSAADASPPTPAAATDTQAGDDDADLLAQSPPRERSDVLAPAPPLPDVDQDPLLDTELKGRPTPAPAAAPGAPPPRDYYVKARGYRVTPESDPPRYVRNAATTGFPLLEKTPWLDLGLEHRMRFEYRQNSLLRTPQEGWDYPFYLRDRKSVV